MAGKIIQMEMFESEKKEALKKGVDKAIRGLFARYNDLEFKLIDMDERLDMISEALMRMKNP